ncbi:MAG TPA: hypothetical protein VFF28_03990 [Candidatus Nanoarchaeia archaeon]|nr:hypothetical protein [Candidatus Nanoarchaeia archaeon]
MPDKREQLREQLALLESLDIKTTRLKQLQEIADSVVDIADALGLDETDADYKRLVGFVERYNAQLSQPDFGLPKRDYWGVLNESLIRVSPADSNLFLSRVYARKIKIGWRFGQEGRLALIDAMIFPENRVHNILTVDGYRSNDAWQTAPASCNAMPYETRLLNPGFERLPLQAQYQSIARFGHSMAADAVRGLESGRIRAAGKLKDGDRQLTDIVGDQAGIYLLRKAGGLMPSVRMVGDNRLMIDYLG